MSYLLKKTRAICSSAHLSWATWANRSHSLICHEQTERFAHSCSFVLSYLSESLTFAHFFWAIWANEQMSNEWMNKFPTLSIIHFLGWGSMTDKPHTTQCPSMSVADRWQTVPPVLRFSLGWNLLFGFSSESLIFLWVKEGFACEKRESLLSLFCHEQGEWITHGHSFVKNDGSDCLRVTLL